MRWPYQVLRFEFKHPIDWSKENLVHIMHPCRTIRKRKAFDRFPVQPALHRRHHRLSVPTTSIGQNYHAEDAQHTEDERPPLADVDLQAAQPEHRKTAEIWILVKDAEDREALLKAVSGCSIQPDVFTVADVASEVCKSGMY
jgi:hypothetical protein